MYPVVIIVGLLAKSQGIMTTDEMCVKQDSCSCKSSNGIIDLHTLGNKDNTARFQNIKISAISGDVSDHERSYYYNPCYSFDVGSFTESEPGCHGVALCEYQAREPQYVDIGQQAKSSFGYDHEKGVNFIHYTSADTNRSSRVYLLCDSNSQDQLLVKGLVNHTVTFQLKSPCACMDRCITMVTLSVGTILCIVFISLLYTYLIVGALYKKAVFGSTGLELIPHYPFWSSLPELIKDGYLFFISPCFSPVSSSARYQQLVPDGDGSVSVERHIRETGVFSKQIISGHVLKLWTKKKIES